MFACFFFVSEKGDERLRTILAKIDHGHDFGDSFANTPAPEAVVEVKVVVLDEDVVVVEQAAKKGGDRPSAEDLALLAGNEWLNDVVS